MTHAELYSNLDSLSNNSKSSSLITVNYYLEYTAWDIFWVAILEEAELQYVEEGIAGGEPLVMVFFLGTT